MSLLRKLVFKKILKINLKDNWLLSHIVTFGFGFILISLDLCLMFLFSCVLVTVSFVLIC